MQHTPHELLIEADLLQLAYLGTNHSVDAVQFLHTEHRDRQYLAFKGTASNDGRLGWLGFFWDILTDVRFLPREDTDYGLGRHPAGFLGAAEDLVEYILDDNTPIDANKPIHMAGHSLGGAVLLIAAPVMLSRGLQVRSLITMGAPNVGDLPDLGENVKVTCLRNGKDFVPNVPPFYGDSYKTTQLETQSKGWIADHRLDAYIKAIHELNQGKAGYV